MNWIKQKRKEYYEKIAEKLREQRREYYHLNKEKSVEREKTYREINRQKINERARIYAEARREHPRMKSNEKVICECGSTVRRGYMAKHRRSNKHKRLNETQTVI